MKYFLHCEVPLKYKNGMKYNKNKCFCPFARDSFDNNFLKVCLQHASYILEGFILSVYFSV